MCELCTARAQHEGWIREDGGDELTLRASRTRARARLLRAAARRAASAPARSPTRPPRRRSRRPAPSPSAAGRRASRQREPPPRPAARARATSAPCRPTPSSRSSGRSRSSTRPSTRARSAASPARSGAPAVSARPLADRPSVVAIAVMWELCWYRFEIDLSDEAGGVRQIAQGAELSELDADEQVGTPPRTSAAACTSCTPNDETRRMVEWTPRHPTGRIALVIYCVVPEPLAHELYDQLAAYYEDDPNVTVIIDRRKSERRDRAARAPPAASARSAIAGAPAWRASSRPSAADVEALAVKARRPRGRRRARQPGPGRRGRRALDARRRRASTRPRETLGAATNNVAEYRGLLLGLERAARARRHRGRGRQRLRADRPPGHRPLQGQAPGHEAAARRGARALRRLRALVDPPGAAGRRTPTPTPW